VPIVIKLKKSELPEIQETKPKWFKRWNRRIRYFRRITYIFLLYVGLASAVSFNSFMIEEAIQQAGFPIFVMQSIRPPPYNETMQAIATYERLVDALESWTYAVGWLNPIAYNGYLCYVEGCRANAAMQKVALKLKVQQQVGVLPNVTKPPEEPHMDITFVWENASQPMTLKPLGNRTFIAKYSIGTTTTVVKDITSIFIARDNYNPGYLFVSVTTKNSKYSVGKIQRVHIGYS